MDAARLERLLDRYLDEAITAEEKTELEQILRAEPEARQTYWRNARFHALLREAGAEGRGREMAEEPRRNPWQALGEVVEGWWRHAGWITAVAVAVVAMVGIWRARQHVNSPSDELTRGVAVLAQSIDLEWESGSAPLPPGAAIDPGWLRIRSGLAQIEFGDGARMLLEGPAELQIVSRAEAYCRRGRMSVQVPVAARGFKVASAQLSAVDLGTAFGFEVRGGASELHVFEGKVQVVEGKSAPRELSAGHALEIDADGARREFAATLQRFPSAAALEEKAASSWERRNQVWRAAAAELRKDPTVLLHYTFENTSPYERRLYNAVSGVDRASDGAIVGSRWVEGRWPGRSALEFKGTGDRVRVEVPGVFDAMTLAAWVRVDGLDHRFNALLMADGFDSGGLHWQITGDGCIQLGISGPQNRPGQDCKTAAVFTPAKFGQWVNLVVVIDRAAHRVAHYVDGREASSDVLKFDVPLGFGRAEVGNWNPATRHDGTPVRNLNGRMDELLVLRRVLTPQEIKTMAQQGPALPPSASR